MSEILQAYFAGGCFWCTEAIFQKLKGVIKVVPGYAGGEMPNPDYQAVSSGETGHAEVIKIEFDSETISYQKLLEVFFSTHDPTTKDMQGADVGTQYRSIIFYLNDQQKTQARDFINKLTEEKIFQEPIVTELVPFDKFYPAEEYHRDYYQKNPQNSYCQVVINPKLKKFKDNYKHLLK